MEWRIGIAISGGRIGNIDGKMSLIFVETDNKETKIQISVTKRSIAAANWFDWNCGIGIFRFPCAPAKILISILRTFLEFLILLLRTFSAFS